MVAASSTSALSSSNSARTSAHPGFARFAWGILVYILLVILFGAWVRITGSGAGCGDHWPTCHGELIPRSPRLETIIEYTHRVTSGVLGPLVLGLVGWAWWGAGRRRVVRLWAIVTALFVVFEALIGAGLVLAELVADDDSVARAVVIALHLGNTLVLTAASALTAWFGAGRAIASWLASRHRWWLWVGVAGVVIVSMTGAVTALGDTLFPVKPTQGAGLMARLRDDLSLSAHFLVRLRIVHPVLAVALSGYLFYLGRSLADAYAGAGQRLARWLAALSALQLGLGAVNIALGAPGWMQLAHLLAAQLLWIVLILLYAESCRAAGPASAGLPSR